MIEENLQMMPPSRADNKQEGIVDDMIAPLSTPPVLFLISKNIAFFFYITAHGTYEWLKAAIDFRKNSHKWNHIFRCKSELAIGD